MPFKLRNYMGQLESNRLIKGSDLYYDNSFNVDITVKGATIEAKANVQGSNGSSYSSGIEFNENRIKTCSCNCPDFRNIVWVGENYPCKHIVAVLISALHQISENESDYQISKISSLVKLSNNINDVVLYIEHNDIKIRPYLEYATYQGFKVGFKVGKERYHFLKDFDEFIWNVNNNIEVAYGKTLKFKHNRNSFNETGSKLFEIIEDFCDSHKSNCVNNSRIDLYNFGRDKLKRVLSIADDMEFKNEKDTSRIYKRVNNIDVKDILRITYSEAGCTFETIKVVDRIGFNNFMIEIYDDTYYVMNDEKFNFISNFRKLFDQNETTCSFNTNDTNYILNFVLENASKYFEIEEVDTNFKPEKYFFTPNLLFYLDYYNHNIIVDFKIELENNTIKFEESSDDINYNHTLTESIYDNYFLPYIVEKTDDSKYVLSDDKDKVIDFLEKVLPNLYDYGDVYASESFKKINVIKRVKVSSKVSVLSNLLDLQIEVDGINKDELFSVLNSYKNKVKYHRLKDGSLINTNDSNIKDLYDLYDNLNLEEKDLKDGSFVIPKYRSLYIDKLLSEINDNDYVKDDMVKSIVNNFERITKSLDLPTTLKDVLRPYQIDGINWLNLLDQYNFGGILADDMGLGKTLQMITFLLAKKLDDSLQTSLVVTPASLLYNWESEFHRFAPSLKVVVVEGNKQVRKQIIESYNHYDVIITSYDLLRSDLSFYKTIDFHYHIIDEAQYIKNNTAQLTKSVKLIVSKQRFALTGTPIENRLSELWSIFDFVLPKYLYSYDYFRKNVEVPIVKYNDTEKGKQLSEMVKPFIMRRLKKEVLKDLPDKIEKVIYSRFEPIQQSLYDAHVLNIRNEFDNQDEKEFSQNKIAMLAKLTKLRQVCCDPNLIYDNYQGNSAKLSTTFEVLDSAIEGNHKVLLFSQFTSMLDIIEKRLNEHKISYFRIDGSTSKIRRMQLVNRFNKDDTSVFIISLKAGGTGLNLTAADIVIHYDPWWNVAVTNQATDRSHRIGQKNTVTVYKVVCENTIEEKIIELQDKKQELADQIIGNTNNNLSTLSKDDFIKLFED